MSPSIRSAEPGLKPFMGRADVLTYQIDALISKKQKELLTSMVDIDRGLRTLTDIAGTQHERRDLSMFENAAPLQELPERLLQAREEAARQAAIILNNLADTHSKDLANGVDRAAASFQEALTSEIGKYLRELRGKNFETAFAKDTKTMAEELDNFSDKHKRSQRISNIAEKLGFDGIDDHFLRAKGILEKAGQNIEATASDYRNQMISLMVLKVLGEAYSMKDTIAALERLKSVSPELLERTIRIPDSYESAVRQKQGVIWPEETSEQKKERIATEISVLAASQEAAALRHHLKDGVLKLREWANEFNANVQSKQFIEEIKTLREKAAKVQNDLDRVKKIKPIDFETEKAKLESEKKEIEGLILAKKAELATKLDPINSGARQIFVEATLFSYVSDPIARADLVDIKRAVNDIIKGLVNNSDGLLGMKTTNIHEMETGLHDSGMELKRSLNEAITKLEIADLLSDRIMNMLGSYLREEMLNQLMLSLNRTIEIKKGVRGSEEDTLVKPPSLTDKQNELNEITLEGNGWPQL